MHGSSEDLSWESFGVALTRLRGAAGFTVRQLAERSRDLDGTGVTSGYISRLSHDTDRPSPIAIERLAHALDVAPQYFLAYRLAQARSELDECGPAGVEGAARQLRIYTAAAATDRE